MDVFECVSSLSSIRTYVKKSVSDEVVMKVMEAGRLAPSAHNDQPWQFILVRDKEKIEELQKYCLSGSFVHQVDFAVVVLTDKSSRWKDIDGTRAAQNMILTAWSYKLGSCWIGRINKEGLKNFLNVPDNWDVLTVLPFGYFNERLLQSTKYRMSPKDVFHLNSFGNNLKL